ncbi:outer membrane protein assembly factor BamD [Thiohalorhabdus methylotrophus]|uniref:Outer membrane protein assembly factor BamD n=1 Tax=Thiohalorhabdus methylotrophus TaxID=3242694 RepID=A0ABV4TVJ7_9GAMM
MRRLTRNLAALLAALLLAAGCNTLEVAEGDSPEEILAKAREAMEQRLYSQAIDNYQRLESLYPYSRRAIQAQIMTAYAYYLKGDSLAAVNAAERFIRLHPSNPHVDYALYLKGIAQYQKIGKSDRDPEPARKALEALSQLIRQHPESEYVPDAHARLRKVDEILAAHELHVARFYMDREAFLAVANRTQTILTEHPGTPSVEPALALLTRSYAELRLEDLARDTLAILSENYPDSSYLSGARSAVSDRFGESANDN